MYEGGNSDQEANGQRGQRGNRMDNVNPAQSSGAANDGVRNSSKNKGDATNRTSNENGDQGNAEEKKEWFEFSNVKEKIEMKNYYSTFEFLKIILYQQKKEKRYEEYLKNKDSSQSLQP